MAYVMKIVFRSRAGLTATAYSEEIVADWTLPVPVTPLLSSGTGQASTVIRAGVVPPGGSIWDGIRAFNWVGASIQNLIVGHDSTHCEDPVCLRLV